jgi:predicted restriction endonuclease
LWNALVLRDGHCRIGGCDRPASWCEAHHIHWVEHGGPTRLDNLLLVCSRHHHLIHQHRWPVKLDPDGNVEVTLDDGTILASRPPPHPWHHPAQADDDGPA